MKALCREPGCLEAAEKGKCCQEHVGAKETRRKRMHLRAPKAESPFASIEDAFNRLFAIPTDGSCDDEYEAERERCRKRVEWVFNTWARSRK